MSALFSLSLWSPNCLGSLFVDRRVPWRPPKWIETAAIPRHMIRISMETKSIEIGFCSTRSRDSFFSHVVCAQVHYGVRTFRQQTSKSQDQWVNIDFKNGLRKVTSIELLSDLLECTRWIFCSRKLKSNSTESILQLLECMKGRTYVQKPTACSGSVGVREMHTPDRK